MNFQKIDTLIREQQAQVSVYIKDMTGCQLLYTHNPLLKMRSASIIKLLILAKCAERFAEKSLTKDTIIQISEPDKVPFSLVSDLSTNAWRLDDLAMLMIILSDNTATNVLIDLLGFDQINEVAKKLGLENTVLQRKMMDFESAQKGIDNFTSLMDTVNLLELYYNGSIGNETESHWMLDTLKKQKHRTMLCRYLPETVEIAHKTGLNDGIQHDVGFMRINDRDILIGVFIEGEPHEINGFECIGRIAKVVYEEVYNAY